MGVWNWHRPSPLPRERARVRGCYLCCRFVLSLYLSPVPAPSIAILVVARRRFPPDFSAFHLTSLSLHTTSFSPHKSPVSSAHCLKGPACHRGGEGAVGSREQDDERLDEVHIGRGSGAGGELLGRQRAGGADAPWPGCCRAGAANHPGCGDPDGCPFPASRGSAISCCRAQHFRAWIAAFYSKRCRGLRGILLIYTGRLVRGAVGITPVRVGYCA